MSNNKTEGLSILDSGVMSQVYSYRVKVDGKTQLVFETFSLDTQNGTSVSYTHLTLPTILRV